MDDRVLDRVEELESEKAKQEARQNLKAVRRMLASERGMAASSTPSNQLAKKLTRLTLSAPLGNVVLGQAVDGQG